MNYATATIVEIVKYFLVVFDTDVDRNAGPVVRSLMALAAVNTDKIVQDLAGKIAAWRAGETDYRHPLSIDQFVLAKRLVCRYGTTLARIAKSKAASGELATPATPPAVAPTPTAVPKALDNAPRKRSATRKPRTAKKKVEYATTPDVGGLAPWEHDDLAWREEVA